MVDHILEGAAGFRLGPFALWISPVSTSPQGVFELIHDGFYQEPRVSGPAPLAKSAGRGWTLRSQVRRKGSTRYRNGTREPAYEE